MSDAPKLSSQLNVKGKKLRSLLNVIKEDSRGQLDMRQAVDALYDFVRLERDQIMLNEKVEERLHINLQEAKTKTSDNDIRNDIETFVRALDTLEQAAKSVFLCEESAGDMLERINKSAEVALDAIHQKLGDKEQTPRDKMVTSGFRVSRLHDLDDRSVKGMHEVKISALLKNKPRSTDQTQELVMKPNALVEAKIIGDYEDDENPSHHPLMI